MATGQSNWESLRVNWIELNAQKNQENDYERVCEISEAMV
jgi:hypothetical protein